MISIAVANLGVAGARVGSMVPALLSYGIEAVNAANMAVVEGADIDSANIRLHLNDAVQAVRRAAEAIQAAEHATRQSEAYERWHEDAFGARTDGTISEERMENKKSAGRR